MPYAVNNGVRIYWREEGSGDPVLLIMGLSFTHEMWFRVLPALASKHRVILFDNRGMGRSDVPKGPYRIGHMAADAAAVLEAAGVASAHIVGASMGGMIAQEMALRWPSRVRSLLLACTSYGGILARWPNPIWPKGIKWAEAERRQRELALIPLLYSPTTPLARIEEDLDIRAECNWTYKGFLSQFAGVLIWSSYLRLSRISAPTLVVHGDSDRLIPPQNGRVLAARIPGSRFVLVPNAGHILTTDQPEFCQELVSEFVR